MIFKPGYQTKHLYCCKAMYVGRFTFLCSATMEQSVLSLNSPPCDFQANLSQTSFFPWKNRKPVTMQSAVISCRNIFSLFLVYRTKHVEEQKMCHTLGGSSLKYLKACSRWAPVAADCVLVMTSPQSELVIGEWSVTLFLLRSSDSFVHVYSAVVNMNFSVALLTSWISEKKIDWMGFILLTITIGYRT